MNKNQCMRNVNVFFSNCTVRVCLMESFYIASGGVSITGVECTAQGSGQLSTAAVQCVC